MKKPLTFFIIINLAISSAFAQSTIVLPSSLISPAIKSTSLSGAGTRLVYATSDGTLTSNYTPTSSTMLDTSYYSVPAAEFRRSQGGNVLFSNGEISGAIGTTDTLIAPVNLPHGAKIIKFSFCYKDATANSAMQAQLMHTTVNSPNRTVLINTSVSSGTVAAGNNYGCTNAPNIPIPTIGNNKNSYWIRVIPKAEAGGNDYNAWAVGGGLRIVHFLIEYTITH